METDDMQILNQGGEVFANGKVYRKCMACTKIVRTNGFFGSMHHCVERQQIPQGEQHKGLGQ